MFKKSVLLVGALLLAGPALDARQPAQQAQRPAAPPSIEDRTSGMKKMDGYFPLYWDERSGGMFLEIPRFDTEFLFSTGLSAGLGSNDIGLIKLATPITVKFEDLRGGVGGLDAKVESPNFGPVWKGGEWKLRNITDYMTTAWYQDFIAGI